MVVRGYRQALKELYGLRRFGLAPGLEVVRALLSELGNPQTQFPAVHVTGSKGKGSVAAMTAALLTAHGHRTGLYTSPHLVRYRERARIDGSEITPEEVVRGLKRIETAVRLLRLRNAIARTPTFFETTTALALDWFARERVTAAVVEVGIGGRWDATNVLDSRVGVVTTLELEHADLLGPTLAEIGEEKAGIFHRGMRGITGHLPPEGRSIVERRARENDVPLLRLGEQITVTDRVASPRDQRFVVRWPQDRSLAVRLPLLGRFQAGNAAMAVAAASLFLSKGAEHLKQAAAQRAFARFRWPGRVDRVGRRPPTYFDVAHTPESAQALVESIQEVEPAADPAQSAVLFGCLEGKDASRMLSTLSGLARTVVLVPIRSERTRSPASLKSTASPHFRRVVVAPSAADGFVVGRSTVGPHGVLIATGSDYLIGELMRSADPLAEEEPDLSDPGTVVMRSEGSRRHG